jgi:hypothetical protein
VSCITLALALVCAFAVGSASAQHAPRVRDLPRHHLTPGAHFVVGKAAICKSGYAARIRHIPKRVKKRAYARYGLRRNARGYQLDRLISLGIGGSNAITNVWPQHSRGPWGARTKQRLEHKLHRLVCSGRLSLASAQRQEAANWIKAYKRYVIPASAKSANPATPPKIVRTPGSGPDLPRHHLTPGAHLAVGKATICTTGYAARVRPISRRVKARAYARYGLRRTARGYQLDRLVSLGIGGSNAITNLWPEHYREPWGARTKDRLEHKLYELVCSGRLSLAAAQQQEAANWIQAYKRYVVPATPKSPPIPTPATPPKPGTPSVPATPAPVELTGTIRAAFYYPWFPQTWGRDLTKPFTNYVPTRGHYSTDLPTVKAQIADLQYAGVRLGIASWFGPTSTINGNWPVLFQAAQGTGFRWAPYYEAEALADPAPAVIAADLHYLRSTYGGVNSALAMMPGGRMLVFVYNAGDLDTAKGCATVTRWKQAQDILQQQYGEGVYVDLKLFRAYQTCPDSASIGGWHQYGPASAVQDASRAPGGGSFAISPGFWKSGVAFGTAPFLGRDRARWQAGIAAMNASGAKWQLITTYNEWGEGTAIESSSGCQVAPPAGTYCDWSAGGTTSELITDLHRAPPPP